MSIADKITLLQQDINNARTAITNKGGTVTPSGGSSQLANDINTIPTGGSSGYTLYVKFMGSDDYIYIKLNDLTPIKISQYNVTYWDFDKHITLPDEGVTKFKIYGADHPGIYPSYSSSWARYKAHTSDTWTEISLPRTEEQAQEIVLTEDTDLEVYEGTCLDYRTLITMADGTYKRVIDIKKGDIVINHEGNPQTVTKDEYQWSVYANEKDIWTFEDNHTITTAFQHRFYNYEHQQYMYLQDWKIGEHAITQDGKKVALLNHEHIEEPIRYSSLWTDGYNNYYANGLLAGNRHSLPSYIK